MSNLSVVTCEQQVAHTPHYRTTLTGVGVTTEVFIELTSTWQVHHEHLFEDLDRSGSACCIGCGAHAWCESWVADGYQGERTHLWADDLYRAYMDRMERDREEVEAMKSEALALVAVLNPNEPA